MKRKLAGFTALTMLTVLLALVSVVDIASRVLAPQLERVGGKTPALVAAVRERVDVTLLETRVRVRRIKEALAGGVTFPAAFRASRMPLVSWGAPPAFAFAAASADRLITQKDADEKAYPVKASTKIYAGTMVALDANGVALPAADAANLKVVGIADVQADNSAGAAGDIKVKVRRGVFKLPASSITDAMVGKLMYVVDDQTFDDAKGTNGIKAGRLVERISNTEGWIEILGAMGPGAVVADAAVTAVADADATYGQPEADLINDIKAKYNATVALVNELKAIVNTNLG